MATTQTHLQVVDVVTRLVNMTTMVAGKEKIIGGDNYIIVMAKGLPDPETGQLFEEMINEETGEPKGPHEIYIPIEAISSRMVKHGYRTHEDSLEHILREHAIRLHGLEGEEVNIGWAANSKTAASEVLDHHRERIISDYISRKQVNDIIRRS